MGHFLRIILLAAALPAVWHGVRAQAPQYTDEDVEQVLRKPGLKILHIGNSYTYDTVCYLPEIVRSTGTDVSDLCIYTMMMGGASFRDWYNVYNGDYPWQDYKLMKALGGMDANVTEGTMNGSDGSMMRRTLTDGQWDIVFIQHSPLYSPYYDLWGGHGAGGYLGELLDVVRTNQPHALVGMVLLHSFAGDYKDNAEGSSLERWRLTAESMERCCQDYGIRLVLPYGTAVQNLRASSLDNGMDLTSDGVHCELLLARYTAACCYYQSILSPRSGIPVSADRTRIDAAWFNVSSPIISVDATTGPVARRAAMLAAEDWHRCINPETDIVVGMEHVQQDGAGQDVSRRATDAYTLQGTRLQNARGKGIRIEGHRKTMGRGASAAVHGR